MPRADEREPRGEQAILLERIRQPKHQPAVFRNSLNIARHVAAFGRIEIEGRRVPILRFEEGAEQKRLPNHLHIGFSSTAYSRKFA